MAGQIITVDWRMDPNEPGQDPQPPEPNKLRPAVVVQECELLDYGPPDNVGSTDHREHRADRWPFGQSLFNPTATTTTER
jgi:hypothetical protein